MEKKLKHAGLMRDYHGPRFEVAVDEVDCTLHQALSPKPNAAYIIDKEGTILFRAHWGLATRKAWRKPWRQSPTASLCAAPRVGHHGGDDADVPASSGCPRPGRQGRVAGYVDGHATHRIDGGSP